MTLPAAPLRLPATEGRDRRRWWRDPTRAQRATVLLVEIVAILLVWEWATGVARIVNPVFLPPPSRILGGFGDLFRGPDLGPNLMFSATCFLIGYVLAVLVGIPLGLLVGGSRISGRLGGPLMWALYALPWSAARPIATVWFGFGAGPVIFLVFVAALFPIMLNTAAGAQTVPTPLLAAGRVFGAGRLTIFRKVSLPAILPFVMVGLRHAVVVGMIGLLFAEITGSAKGIGALIKVRTSTFDTDQAYALIVIVVIATRLLGSGVDQAGKRLTPWARTER